MFEAILPNYDPKHVLNHLDNSSIHPSIPSTIKDDECLKQFTFHLFKLVNQPPEDKEYNHREDSLSKSISSDDCGAMLRNFCLHMFVQCWNHLRGKDVSKFVDSPKGEANEWASFIVHRLNDVSNIQRFLDQLKKFARDHLEGCEHPPVVYRFPGGKRKDQQGRWSAWRELREEFPILNLPEKCPHGQFVGSFNYVHDEPEVQAMRPSLNVSVSSTLERAPEGITTSTSEEVAEDNIASSTLERAPEDIASSMIEKSPEDITSSTSHVESSSASEGGLNDCPSSSSSSSSSSTTIQTGNMNAKWKGVSVCHIFKIDGAALPHKSWKTGGFEEKHFRIIPLDQLDVSMKGSWVDPIMKVIDHFENLKKWHNTRQGYPKDARARGSSHHHLPKEPHVASKVKNQRGNKAPQGSGHGDHSRNKISQNASQTRSRNNVGDHHEGNRNVGSCNVGNHDGSVTGNKNRNNNRNKNRNTDQNTDRNTSRNTDRNNVRREKSSNPSNHPSGTGRHVHNKSHRNHEQKETFDEKRDSFV